MKEDKSLELKRMELHDKICIDEYTDVIKVLNGWIYITTRSDSSGIAVSSCFVPRQ